MKKMWTTLAVLIISPLLISTQIYYPDEQTGGFSQNVGGNSQQQTVESKIQPINTVNLSEIRGTSLYEDYVNRIIAKGIAKLTLAVDKAISITSGDRYDNIVYAPVSIAGALALVLLGSNGQTFNELVNIMGLTTGVNIENKSQLVHEHLGRMLQILQATAGFDVGHQVNVATAIFVQHDYPIRKAYKGTAESIYRSEVLNVDFATNPENSQQVINAWVSDRTKGKIQTLLTDPPSVATKVILASAMYFKAEWEKPFFDGSTRRRPFYTNGRSQPSDVMMDMMSNGGYFPYYKDTILDCEILGFPYKGNHTTMYVVVPTDSDKNRLKNLEKRLDAEEIARLVESVNYTDAVVLFPKMKIDSTIDLSKSLQLIGVRTLFNPHQANLALLSPGNINNASSTLDVGEVVSNPISAKMGDEEDESSVLIFSRNGAQVNCTPALNAKSNVTTCNQVVEGEPKTVVFKKFGNKIGRRITTRGEYETVDSIRQYLNKQNDPEHFENPGLYVDSVIHKVYMDITESGTEAAAATTVSLSRDGGRITFRVDVPFFFFILHEQTKTLLFWGTVHTPTPNYPPV